MYVELTLEQCGVRGADPCAVENHIYNFTICGSACTDSTNCTLGSTVVCVYRKKIHAVDPCSSNPCVQGSIVYSPLYLSCSYLYQCSLFMWIRVTF